MRDQLLPLSLKGRSTQDTTKASAGTLRNQDGVQVAQIQWLVLLYLNILMGNQIFLAKLKYEKY